LKNKKHVKNIPFFGTALKITIFFAVFTLFFACAEPSGDIQNTPDTLSIIRYIVSFDSNGGSHVGSQILSENQSAEKPIDPFKYPQAGLYIGLDLKCFFIGWYRNGELWDFDTEIIESITLTAEWSAPVPVKNFEENNFAALIDYVNETPNTYTMFLDSDFTISTQKLDRKGLKGDLKLNIIGIGKERKIFLSELSEKGTLFDIKRTNTSGLVELTLGNNITLVGKDDNDYPLVMVGDKSHFIMLDGSKITGNHSSSKYSDTKIDSAGSTVYVKAGNFTMKGGEISGNKNNFPFFRGGIVFVTNDSNFNMEGGSIAENENNFGNSDVSIYFNGSLTLRSISFILSGNARLNSINLGTNYYTIANTPSIAISSAFAKSDIELNLHTGEDSIEKVSSHWNNKTILQGYNKYTINMTDIAKIKLMNFYSDSGTKKPITDSHKLSNTGSLSKK